jgi:hypothetical protein
MCRRRVILIFKPMFGSILESGGNCQCQCNAIVHSIVTSLWSSTAAKSDESRRDWILCTQNALDST